MAMTQITKTSSSTTPKTMSKKRQLVPNNDFPSSTSSSIDKHSPEHNTTTVRPIELTSHLSNQPLPRSTVSHNKCSAISSFLQHLKQTTSASSIEIISDNPMTSRKVEEIRELHPAQHHRMSPKQQHEKGRPSRIVMTPDQKKIVRWDTHSSTYKVAAATAAAVALATSKDSSTSSHDSIDPTSGMSFAIPPFAPVVASVRRASAAAPTCPRRRQSKEDCLQVDDQDDSRESANSYDNNITHQCVKPTTNISHELARLREQIEREEEYLKQVVHQASSTQVRERRASIMGGTTRGQAAAPVLQEVEKDGVSPRPRHRKQIMMNARGTSSQHYRRSSDLSSSSKFIHTKGGLPDYRMALNAVAQRYATGPGVSLPSRSASTGMLPTVSESSSKDTVLESRATTSTITAYTDAPLGIPRRRESADIAILAVLDEASNLAESPLAP